MDRSFTYYTCDDCGAMYQTLEFARKHRISHGEPKKIEPVVVVTDDVANKDELGWAYNILAKKINEIIERLNGDIEG